jgi:hypothetical protein
MVSVEVARVPSRANHVDDGPTGGGQHLQRPGASSIASVWDLLLWQTGAVTIQVLAVCMARHDASALAYVVSCCGLALTFASAVWFLTGPRPARAVRNAAVVCLGVTTFVQWRAADPLVFNGYDEQMHIRTLRDIESSRGLFQAHPILAVSPHYPGLEAVAALFHQFGLPMMAAAMAVVLVARLVLVLVLCDVVEHLTGSPRAGGLAVAAYAVCTQFVWFNSQFAYQSLALPLALAAVAFIARARWVGNPRPLLSGAIVCLLAVAVTHHVTSLLTAAFLIIWTIAQRGGQARRRVFYGAVIAVVGTVTWAMIQWSVLQQYFGPIIDDVRSQVTGGLHRAPFSDAAGYREPLWERLFEVYYAAVVTLVVLWLMLICARSILRRARSSAPRCNSQRWEPRVVLVLMVAMIPVLMAARILPSGAEIGDRSNRFLFFPFSLLVADGAVRWCRSSRGRHSRFPPPRQVMLVRSLMLVLATGVFVGGYLMGSGPDLARLPGNYAASSNRSMDAETLAAVRWARDGLPAGSRIGADFVGSLLLASEAGLWPVIQEGGLDVSSLYFDDEWGPPQTELARRMRLRYLYVDRRLADELPRAGRYFFSGETSEPRQLTRVELTKFDTVPGIHMIYRHGPIYIYDLSGLGVPELRSGWYGETRPPIHVSIQLVIGLLAGLALAAVGRFGSTVIEMVRMFRTAAGPSLTFAAGVGALCIASITMLLANIWLGPTVFLSMALVVLLAKPRWVMYRLRNSAARRHWRWVAASLLLLLPVATAIAMSVAASPSAKGTSGLAGTLLTWWVRLASYWQLR